jgi:hypothetical protein
MESLRVPKHRAPVEVVWVDGVSQLFDVFLADSAPGHEGPERLSDLLGDEISFVPAFDHSDGPIWLNLANVVAVRAIPELDPLSDVETLPTEHEVEVTITTGAVFRGLISYVRPDEQSRLTDFLNDGRMFLRLLDGASVVFVNKRHVLRIVAPGWKRGAT